MLQAEQTALHLAKLGIDEIYSSPLRRARQTAEVIARPLGLTVTIMEEFKELQVGSLEGNATPENWTLHNEIVKGWLRGYPDLAFPGGGDTFTSLAERLVRGVRQVTAGKHGRQIVIVGHGGQFTFALGALCPDADMAATLAAPMSNCAVSTFETPAGDNGFAPRLIRWAAVDHISGEAAEFAPMHPGAGKTFAGTAQP